MTEVGLTHRKDAVWGRVAQASHRHSRDLKRYLPTIWQICSLLDFHHESPREKVLMVCKRGEGIRTQKLTTSAQLLEIRTQLKSPWKFNQYTFIVKKGGTIYALRCSGSRKIRAVTSITLTSTGAPTESRSVRSLSYQPAGRLFRALSADAIDIMALAAGTGSLFP